MPTNIEIWSAWESALGPEGIIYESPELDVFEANATGWQHRLAGVLRPNSVAQVQEVVRIAAKHQAVLYPVSCGHNWGYGSRLPPEETGTVLLDLSRMNRIRNEADLSRTQHVAEIEPGVTQGQMAALLRNRNLPLLFNATGAGPSTSLLGNSLERGVGYFGLRTHDLSDLEVVLGTGEILRTGAATLSPDAKTRLHYPYGLGPSLDGLFFQSNLGVVTSAGFRLIPRRACHGTLIAKLKDPTRLAAFIDSLADIRRQGLIESVLHVGSPNRVRVTLSPLVYRAFLAQGSAPSAALRQKVETLVQENFQETWTAVGPIFGTAAQVEAARAEINDRLAPFAEVTLITESDLAQESDALSKTMIQPLVDLCQGHPSGSALDSPHWSLGKEPPNDPSALDETETGLRFCSPAVPLDGPTIVWAIEQEKTLMAEFGYEPYVTVNLIDEKSALLITNLVFNKADPKAQQQADMAITKVIKAWAAHGLYPYRLGLCEEAHFTVDPVHAACLESLKNVFDPQAVFSRGRYMIPTSYSNMRGLRQTCP